MSAFDLLFGKKRSGAHSKREGGSSSATSDEDRKTRRAHCDICGERRPAVVTETGAFLANVIVVAEKAPQLGIASIGACTSCDIDVCSRCAKWLQASDVMGELDAAMGEAGADSTLPELLRKHAKKPACPNCEAPLTSKTAADIERLRTLFCEVLDANAARRQENCARLLRICLDEDPVFRKLLGEEKFATIQEQLMLWAR